MKRSIQKYDLLQPENFGEWLTNERRSRDLSRKELAYLADVDVTSIYGYEVYGHSPTLNQLLRIVGALGLMIVIKRCDDGQED